MLRKPKTVIGRAERADFPDSDIVNIPVKVDTGAFRSSIWATNIKEENGELSFVLLGKTSKYYSGKVLRTKQYLQVEVENSFGHKETRYSVYLRITLAGRTVKTNFTLANRSLKTYPVLLGRKLLKNKFIVDVSQGKPLDDEEVTSKGGLT